MKTAKNIVTRGFLIAVLAFMAMTAIDMAKNGTVFSTKVAQAKIKIPKNAKSNEAKAAKKIDESKAYNKISSCKWKSGKLIKLDLSVIRDEKIDLSAFTSLTDLKLVSSNISNLDLSKNKKLKSLIITKSNQRLENINLTKCKNLQILKIYGTNKITKIDLSKNSNLNTLELHYSGIGLSALNLSKNGKLKTLGLSNNNKISVLDLSKNSKLEDINLSYNGLTQCSLPGNVKNVSVTCPKLTQLDLSNRKQLSNLVVACPKLSSFNISGSTSLKEFRMSSNNLASLDLSGLTSLSKITFDVMHNFADLHSVDLTNCSSLQLENVKFWGVYGLNAKFLYNGLYYQYYGSEKGWLEVKPDNG